jgi:hypothetical protein
MYHRSAFGCYNTKVTEDCSQSYECYSHALHNKILNTSALKLAHDGSGISYVKLHFLMLHNDES